MSICKQTLLEPLDHRGPDTLLEHSLAALVLDLDVGAGEPAVHVQLDLLVSPRHVVNTEAPVDFPVREHLRVFPRERLIRLVELEGRVLVEEDRILDGRTTLDDLRGILAPDKASQNVVLLLCLVHDGFGRRKVCRTRDVYKVTES